MIYKVAFSQFYNEIILVLNRYKLKTIVHRFRKRETETQKKVMKEQILVVKEIGV